MQDGHCGLCRTLPSCPRQYAFTNQIEPLSSWIDQVASEVIATIKFSGRNHVTIDQNAIVMLCGELAEIDNIDLALADRLGRPVATSGICRRQPFGHGKHRPRRGLWRCRDGRCIIARLRRCGTVVQTRQPRGAGMINRTKFRRASTWQSWKSPTCCQKNFANNAKFIAPCTFSVRTDSRVGRGPGRNRRRILGSSETKRERSKRD